jgi:hypothetical protein
MGIGYASGRSVWGDRHMSVVAIPYFILIGIACSRLPWPKIALAVQCVVMLWAVEAGIESLLEPNKKFQWRSLVDSMIATGEQPIVVHTLESFRQIPISFYLNRAGVANATVTLDNDLTEIVDDHFWLVYTDYKWHHPDTPEQILQARGFVVDQTTSTSMKLERVVAVRFHRGP